MKSADDISPFVLLPKSQSVLSILLHMEPQAIHLMKDTQSERDHRRIAIDRVGVKNLRYPMQIRDKAHATQGTIANVTLTVDPPPPVQRDAHEPVHPGGAQ